MKRKVVNLSREDNKNGGVVTVILNTNNTYLGGNSVCITGDGNVAATGDNASATINAAGQIRQGLNRIEREFIEGMRQYGKIADWAECFATLKKAKGAC